MWKCAQILIEIAQKAFETTLLCRLPAGVICTVISQLNHNVAVVFILSFEAFAGDNSSIEPAVLVAKTILNWWRSENQIFHARTMKCTPHLLSRVPLGKWIFNSILFYRQNKPLARSVPWSRQFISKKSISPMKADLLSWVNTKLLLFTYL